MYIHRVCVYAYVKLMRITVLLAIDMELENNRLTHQLFLSLARSLSLRPRGRVEALSLSLSLPLSVSCQKHSGQPVHVDAQTETKQRG